MKVVAVVQARVRSSRLPAKVLLDLGGLTALERCLGRVTRIRGVDEVVVASPDSPEDDLVANLARRLGYATWRGSENDVLARYHDAARNAGADVVVRCTSDCPLLDSEISSDVLARFLATQGGPEPLDYVSNVLERRLPVGLDTEVMTMAALARAHAEAGQPHEREHVTARMYQNPSAYRCARYYTDFTPNLGHYRWTLDTLEDYRFLCAVHDELGPEVSSAGWREVLALLDARPELARINGHIAAKGLATSA